MSDIAEAHKQQRGQASKVYALNGIADELFEMRKENREVASHLKDIGNSLDLVSQYLYDLTWLMKQKKDEEVV